MERLDLQDSVYRTEPVGKLQAREQAHTGEDMEFARLQLGRRDEIKDTVAQSVEEARKKRVEEDEKGGADDRRKKDRRKKERQKAEKKKDELPRKKPSLGPQIIDLEI